MGAGRDEPDLGVRIAGNIHTAPSRQTPAQHRETEMSLAPGWIAYKAADGKVGGNSLHGSRSLPFKCTCISLRGSRAEEFHAVMMP